MPREFEAEPHERRVVCEGCGEVRYTEPVGGPEDENPELGDADRLVDIESCVNCDPDDDYAA